MWVHADCDATQPLELGIVETNRPSELLADDEGRLLTDYRRHGDKPRENADDQTPWNHD